MNTTTRVTIPLPLGRVSLDSPEKRIYSPRYNSARMLERKNLIILFIDMKEPGWLYVLYIVT